MFDLAQSTFDIGCSRFHNAMTPHRDPHDASTLLGFAAGRGAQRRQPSDWPLRILRGLISTNGCPHTEAPLLTRQAGCILNKYINIGAKTLLPQVNCSRLLR
jgi:hypothetical protein